MENIEQLILKLDDSYEEHCWETGNYNSDCDCEMCSHKYECSGYDGKETN